MKPHGQFAKNYLEELLSLLGWVEISQEITDQTRQIDLFSSKNREKGKTFYRTIKKICKRYNLSRSISTTIQQEVNIIRGVGRQ